MSMASTRAARVPPPPAMDTRRLAATITMLPSNRRRDEWRGFAYGVFCTVAAAGIGMGFYAAWFM